MGVLTRFNWFWSGAGALLTTFGANEVAAHHLSVVPAWLGGTSAYVAGWVALVTGLLVIGLLGFDPVVENGPEQGPESDPREEQADAEPPAEEATSDNAQGEAGDEKADKGSESASASDESPDQAQVETHDADDLLDLEFIDLHSISPSNSFGDGYVQQPTRYPQVLYNRGCRYW